jgi:hypothetical protein
MVSTELQRDSVQHHNVGAATAGAHDQEFPVGTRWFS